MPKEREGYRDNIEMLGELFPGKVSITTAEAAQALGVNIKTVRSMAERRYNPLPTINAGRKILVPIVGLARFMCGNS